MQDNAIANAIAEDAADSIDNFKKLYNLFLSQATSLVSAFVILIVGWYICKFLCKLLRHTLEKTNLEPSIISFVNSMTKFGLRALLLIIVINKLGVDTTSIIALMTSASLAIGLALQGSLSNLAGGFLILVFKPFQVGDYIKDSEGHEGTVTSIEIVYTHILTPDNQIICIPNGVISNSTVTNSTRQPLRRIDFPVGVNYGENVDKVRTVLLKVADNCKLVDQTENPAMVFVDSFDSSSISVVLRIWCSSTSYWDTRFAIQEAIKEAFEKHEIEIPYNKLDVNIVGHDH